MDRGNDERPRMNAEDAEGFGVERDLRRMDERPSTAGPRLVVFAGRRYMWVWQREGEWRFPELERGDSPMGWVPDPEDEADKPGGDGDGPTE